MHGRSRYSLNNRTNSVTTMEIASPNSRGYPPSKTHCNFVSMNSIRRQIAEQPQVYSNLRKYLNISILFFYQCIVRMGYAKHFVTSCSTDAVMEHDDIGKIWNRSDNMRYSSYKISHEFLLSICFNKWLVTLVSIFRLISCPLLMSVKFGRVSCNTYSTYKKYSQVLLFFNEDFFKHVLHFILVVMLWKYYIPSNKILNLLALN